MATRSKATTRAERRSRYLRNRLAEDMVSGRVASGLSVREVARRAGVSNDTVRRVERAELGAMSIHTVARIGEVLGLELAANLYPNGDPVRDRAHLALISRFRARLAPGVRARVEVPVPIPGDRRSGDAIVDFAGGNALVEAETHLGDLQLVERKAAAKQRDLACTRLILLVADTRHNRNLLRLHPELVERFPIDTRACFRRLTRREDPGGDALVVL